MHSRMICFAGRRLAVLATPPQTSWSGVRELHPCFRTGDPGYCSYTNSAFIQRVSQRERRTSASGWRGRRSATLRWPLNMERAARVELASSGWKPEAPAAIPCSQWREMKDSNLRIWFWRPASWPLNESPANFMAVATGVEPVFPDRQSGVLAARPCDRRFSKGTATLRCCALANCSRYIGARIGSLGIFGCEGRIRTCMDRVRAGNPGQLNDLATFCSRAQQRFAAAPSRTVRAYQRSLSLTYEEGTSRYGLFLAKRSNRNLHHSSNFNSDPILAAGERIERS